MNGPEDRTLDEILIISLLGKISYFCGDYLNLYRKIIGIRRSPVVPPSAGGHGSREYQVELLN